MSRSNGSFFERIADRAGLDALGEPDRVGLAGEHHDLHAELCDGADQVDADAGVAEVVVEQHEVLLGLARRSAAPPPDGGPATLVTWMPEVREGEGQRLREQVVVLHDRHPGVGCRIRRTRNRTLSW